MRHELTELESARFSGCCEGLTEGEAIGRTAEKEQVVINSHHAGLSAETISNITELTIEQIIEILKRHGFLPPAVQY